MLLRSPRENSVINLEEFTDRYEELTGEALIMATMAQSMFMKESEDLASIMQMELDKKLDTPNRGVKQAVFLRFNRGINAQCFSRGWLHFEPLRGKEIKAECA